MNNDIITDAADTLTREVQERTERELRGAWRAGFDYLNVYEADLSTVSLAQESVAQYLAQCGRRAFVPSHHPIPSASYYYDIGAVPDAKIQQAIERSD